MTEQLNARAALKAYATAFPAAPVTRDLTRILGDAACDLDWLQVLADVLIANNETLPEPLLAQAQHALLPSSTAADDQLGVADLLEQGAVFGSGGSGGKEASPRVVVWRGDITRLRVDAIVNAANEQGLGCFQPSHRCIDNVIHRAAGPRLREQCREALELRRPAMLETGGTPLVTAGCSLPARYVFHTVGPQLESARAATAEETAQLRGCYTKLLDAANEVGARSIAFCCVSTGLFMFPAADACKVALGAVASWLAAHEDDTQLDAVVFNVFTEADHALYLEHAPSTFGAGEVNEEEGKLEGTAENSVAPDPQAELVARAAAWLADADAVVVCAGAGMSAQAGFNVYVSEDDFGQHYPDYALSKPPLSMTTAYDCMALWGGGVSERMFWGFYAPHGVNMRWKFPHTKAYDTVRRIVGDRDHFCYTSNVDGGFVRAGFAPDTVYTVQGDWSYYQCAAACRPDAVWPSKGTLERLAASAQSDGQLPSDGDAPVCEHCGGPCRPNVRANSSFLDAPYEEERMRWRGFVDEVVCRPGKKVVILEVGCGFNTPGVTRFPMEALAGSADDGRIKLVRINPTDGQCEVPHALASTNRAIALKSGWEVLDQLLPKE